MSDEEITLEEQAEQLPVRKKRQLTPETREKMRQNLIKANAKRKENTIVRKKVEEKKIKEKEEKKAKAKTSR